MATSRWSRLMPTRRRVVIWIAVLLGLFVVRAALDLWAGYHLRSVSSRMAARYGGLDLTTLMPPVVQPAENRARILSAAAAVTVMKGDTAGRNELNEALRGIPPRDPARLQAALRRVVTDNRLALRILDEAESRPKANWEITYRDGTDMRLPSLMEIRDLATANTAAGSLDLEDGNADEAARRVRIGLVLAGSLAQEPNLLIQLIHIGICREPVRLLRDTLALGEPSPPALETLAPRLEEQRERRPIVVGLIGEMKYRHNRFVGIGRGGTPWTGAGGAGSAGTALLAWLVRPAIRVANARMLEDDDKLIAFGRLDPFEREAQRMRPPSEGLRPWWWRRFGGIVAAGPERAVRAGDEHRALMTLGSTSVALRRFRLERRSYPVSLDALVPAFLPAIPVDPFTGRPPEYKAVGNGFEVRVSVPKEAVPAELFDWKIPR